MNANSLFGVLCLRADARPETGVGHVMRCLALAQSWQDRGGRTVFVTATETPALLNRLQAEGCEVHRLHAAAASLADAAETVAAAGQLDAAWIVIDGYAFTATYLRALREEQKQILAIDDLASLDLSAAQLIVNPNLQATANMYAHIGDDGRVLAGNRYALLRRDFIAGDLQNRQSTAVSADEDLRVLVTMGGSDPPNATGRILEILAGVSSRRLQVTVLAGPANTHLERLKTLCNTLRRRHEVELLVDPPDLGWVVARADVAISAAGTSCWELASLGVPLAVVAVAENQLAGAEALAKRDAAVYLGRHDALDATTVLAQLKALFDQPAL
ncbi:MAG TPA: UDP-2,4-diacetamido-2,4,6-trideoxy-beta-L-altropyranose hydrolase, partial [Woeseiaceae bacterium]|nr:UDP-2,4-diacetamido-2,4,6-trideoxy-beta-L-altropyranose hydrolase [Woeseiaceae bacterium]